MRRKLQVSGTLALISLILTAPTVPSTVAIGWSAPSRLDTTTFIDYVPSATRDSQGRLWVFWEGVRIQPTIRQDIYYKIYSQSMWLNYTLTNDAWEDITPAAVGLQNGAMFVVWASKRSGNYDLYYVTITNGIRSGESQITTGPTDDWGPTVVQGRDNRIWVFWNKSVSNSFDIYYRVYDGISWSVEQSLTTDAAVDLTPAALVAKNGNLWVAWASYRTGKYEIFEKAYDGSTWSPDRQMTSNPANDNESPALLQDSDGMLWLFWNRVLPAPMGRFQTDIYYKTSPDNGVSWSETETPLTSTPDFSENDPTAIQSSDRRLWIFYSSNLAGGSTYDLFYSTSDPILTHDVAVKGVKASPERVRYNASALVEVILANLGDFSETVELRVYVNSTLTFSQVTNLAPMETKIASFPYNTLGTKPGRYLLDASVTPVAGETLVNQFDNSVTGARLHILPPGDMDQDGDVDILDAGTVILAFDSVPGSPNWNRDADVDTDDDVDIVDVAITLLWFDTVT